MGPYYAMFPTAFAFDVVDEYCPRGGSILDPFAGRASSIFAAAATGRFGYGVEINAVGWLYGRVKLRPAEKERVVARLRALGRRAESVSTRRMADLPKFFRACYSPPVLRFLLVARESLRWKTGDLDATLMATILVHLHGKRSQSLSNQMRQGKAMSPDYCVRWWRDRGMDPPELDLVAFLLKRLEWRYAKGIPELAAASLVQGDSTTQLPRLARKLALGEVKRFDLLFTSPPYFGVTNYNYDQWLRYWMLGGDEKPIRTRGIWQSRFEDRNRYRRLLEQVFARCASLMKDDATVYVRTDARQFTYDATLSALHAAFPAKDVTVVARPLSRSTQTALFGDKSDKPGEVDIILRPLRTCVPLPTERNWQPVAKTHSESFHLAEPVGKDLQFLTRAG